MSALLLAALLAAAQDSFPHAAHRRLFASCSTCHAGIVTGDSAAARPAAASCVTCHDGTRERRVDWRPSAPRATNLRYDHVAHVAQERRGARTQAEGEATCTRCHAMGGGAAFMEVGRAAPEQCLTCHAHRAPQHLAATAQCETCHRPLRAATRLATADIARFPRPPSHDSGYVFRHAAGAANGTCAFCHTRESCASCHVNAQRLSAITSLGADPRVAALAFARAAPVYPVPASHRTPSFPRAHGAMASAAGATCASCHARESCLGCHRTEERLAQVAAMPRRAAVGARGVELTDTPPPDHGPGFAVRHRVAASAGDQACSRCHAPSFCATCHDASSSPPFHPANYVARHGAESFGAATECSSCHQPQAFCTSCHRETGRASQTGARAGSYHDNQPRWAFAHGVAARRSIESCASCHRQTDCLQCHSATRGWRVNPHGRGFDASLAEKNRALCLRCHARVP